MCANAWAHAPSIASFVPIPIPTTIKPNWLLREYANTFRKSFSITAKNIGKMVITQPIGIKNENPAYPRANA